MDIFETVLKRSFEGFKAWERHFRSENYRLSPPLLVQEALRIGPNNLRAIVTLDVALQHNAFAPHQQRLYARPPTREQAPAREPSVESADCEAIEVGGPAVVDPTFDDYHTAPPQESNRISTAGTYTFVNDGILQREQTWSQWKDRGLRLVPNFQAVFPQTNPTSYHTESQSADNTLESSPWNDSDSAADNAATPHEQDGVQSASNEAVHGMSEQVTLGLRDMLDEAGAQAGTAESKNVFLLGTDRSANNFVVCPEQDSVAVNPSCIERIMDVDSLIWVGRRVQFRAACHIRLTPSFGLKPPFEKSNHVFVRLLKPPTQMEWDNHEFGSTTKDFNLSQIPHMEFGHVGEGDTRFNVIICFPRMIFKPDGSRFMRALIPQVIQELWLTHCVMAALDDTFSIYPTTKEYIPESVQEVVWKMGDNRKGSTLALIPAALCSLQDHLMEKVRAKPQLLSRFGSFFFAVDSRGFKILSKQHGWNEEAAVTIQKMMPSLDIDYMTDRDKGELVLDMGVSYHAENLEVGPLVGLWKLPLLKESYDSMGFRKPLRHHTNTLSNLGGMQAKARKSARNYQHLLFRLSYNLVFQVIRAAGTKEYLTTVENAIQGNSKFVEGCNRWEMLFSTASSKGYGVRDEIRGSAPAIFNMLDSAREEVIHLFVLIIICVLLDW